MNGKGFMRSTDILVPEGLKLYLVTFEFSNERLNSCFRKGFYASDERDLKRHIDEYFDNYGIKNFPFSEDIIYHHPDTNLSVNLLFWEEITSYEQLGL